MSILQRMTRPPWRTAVAMAMLLGVLALAYLMWSAGARVTDGRHDKRSNGIWIQHGWLGDDAWLAARHKDQSLFRDEARIDDLARLLADHGIKYVYPHLCPCGRDGLVPLVDSNQTERFLDRFQQFKVLPWIGGVLDVNCAPEQPAWRSNFATSATALFVQHPRFAGLHVNIEPLSSGNKGYLDLLDELRRAMPTGTILSVAAYPPPTLWHPHSDVHWDREYYAQVAGRVDQLVPMMYDTAIRLPKCYVYVMSCWTKEVLKWSGGKEVLLGLPAYEDEDAGYHLPRVENLENALRGVHAGLASFSAVPTSYAGVAVYCEWEMTTQKWERLRKEYERPRQ